MPELDFALVRYHGALSRFALALPIVGDREERQGGLNAGLRTFLRVAIASCGIVLAAAGALQGNH